MKVNHVAANVHTLHTEFETGETQRLLVLSDVHYDSTHCDRELLTKHLEEAKATSSPIFLNGDFLDLMGGKYDPRNTLPGGLRPEYRGQDYFDLVIEDAVRYLAPYAHLIIAYGQGNHETNVRKRQHTDPSRRMVEGLKALGSPLALGGYAGWIRWYCTYSTERTSYVIHYHHGMGGNAPRSKGVLHADIDTARYPDADFIVRGHDHNKWHVPMVVERLTTKNHRHRKTIHHVRCGSYKAMGDGVSGWEVEKGFGQPRLGGYWLKVTRSGHNSRGKRDRLWTTNVEEAYW